MKKEIYTVTEMIQIGYSRTLLLELAAADKDRNFSWRASTSQKAKWLFNREKLENYLKSLSHDSLN